MRIEIIKKVLVFALIFAVRMYHSVQSDEMRERDVPEEEIERPIMPPFKRRPPTYIPHPQ